MSRNLVLTASFALYLAYVGGNMIYEANNIQPARPPISLEPSPVTRAEQDAAFISRINGATIHWHNRAEELRPIVDEALRSGLSPSLHDRYRAFAATLNSGQRLLITGCTMREEENGPSAKSAVCAGNRQSVATLKALLADAARVLGPLPGIVAVTATR